MSKFKITQNSYSNGFHITFKNGCTVNVQFGEGSYSDGGETTAEVAAWDQDGNWIKLSDHDDIRRYCSPDEVLGIMNKVASRGTKKMSTFWLIYLAAYIALTLAVIKTLILI